MHAILRVLPRLLLVVISMIPDPRRRRQAVAKALGDRPVHRALDHRNITTGGREDREAYAEEGCDGVVRSALPSGSKNDLDSSLSFSSRLCQKIQIHL